MLITLLLAPAFAQDLDGDGYDASVDDCDDTLDTVHPGAAEPCNGVDDDCDTVTDVVTLSLWQDLDGDAYGAGVQTSGCAAEDGNDGYYLQEAGAARLVVSGYVPNEDDCNDFNANISPAAVEICDDLDNDCSDVIDDAEVGGQLYYEDDDGDGYGAEGPGVWGCSLPSEASVTVGGDCDDLDAATSPGAEEVCDDGVDQDCDGLADGGCDEANGEANAEKDEGCGCASRGSAGILSLAVVPLAFLRRRGPGSGVPGRARANTERPPT